MDFTELFKRQLVSTTGSASKNTVKNYIADLKHFISWYENFMKSDFEARNVNADILKLYQNSMGGHLENGQIKIGTKLSASSIKRHMSTLRKFFSLLANDSYIERNPFDQIEPEVEVKPTDYWHLRSFADYLLLSKVSKLTVKNYVSDIQTFAKWYEQAVLPSITNPLSQNGGFYLITQSILNDYKDRLSTVQNAAPRTINRKLSSLRRYLDFASSKGFIGTDELTLDPYTVSESRIIESLTPTIGLKDIDEIRQEQKFVLSPFPPIRLAQRLIVLPYLGFEEKAASIIASIIAGKSVEGIQKLPTRLVNELNNKNNLRSHKQSISSLISVDNVSREFFEPKKVSLLGAPLHKKVIFHARFTRPNWYKKYHDVAFVHYAHFALLVIFASGVGVALYQNLVVKKQTPTFAAPSSPPRILSFQGRLTDNLDNPITTSRQLRFMIYNNASSSGAAVLWEELRTVSPDQDGIFSVLLGSDVNGANASSCGTFPLGSPATSECLIPSTVFSDNTGTWLGVTVGNTPELAPRQKIATVAYATNSEFLQGLPPITSLGALDAKVNTVLALNSSGNLIISGNANPAPIFEATSGQFTLRGNTLLLSTVLGTDSNVVIQPDGLGKINLQKGLINTTFNGNIVPGGVEVNDKFGVLATESAVAAFVVNNNTTGGDIFTASSSGTPRFTIQNDGTIVDQFYTTAGGIVYTQTGGIFSQTTAGLNGQCLQSAGGLTPTWGTCGGSNYWNMANGTLYPINETLDLLVGGNTTDSAKFRFLNNSAGTPVASVSANSGNNATFMAGDGTIGTTNRQTLTIGNSSTYNTTGNLLFNPNGIGRIGVFTNNPLASFDVRGTSGTQTAASISANTSFAAMVINNLGAGDFLTASKGGHTYFRMNSTHGSYAGTPYEGEFIVGKDGNGKLTALVVDPVIVSNQKTSGTMSLTLHTSGASNADILFQNQSTELSRFTQAGQLQIPITGSNAGITLGGDTQLFRGAADRIDIAANDSINFLSGTGGLMTNGVLRIDSSGAGTFTNVNITGTCTGCVSASNSPFQILNGAIVPLITSTDFLIGGQSTASAKFAVINVGNGTPIASVSSGTNSLSFDANGNIQTTNNNTLTLGGSTTGEINLLENVVASGNISIAGTLDPTNVAAFTLTGAIAGGNQNITSIGDISANSSANTITGFGTVGTNGTTAFTGLSLSITGDATISGGDITGGGGAILDIGEATLGDFTFNGDIIIPEDGFIGLSSSTPRFSFDTSINPDEIDVLSANLDLNDNLITNIGNSATDFTSGGGLNLAGAFDANGQVDLGDGGDTFSLDSSNIDISGGAISGATGIASSGTITFSGFTGANNGGVIFANASGVLSQTAAGTGTQCLLGGTTPTWGSCDDPSSTPFEVINGVIAQKNTTLDFLLGSQASTSAKFAVLNINNGTPTASVSSGLNGTGTYFDANGNFSTVRRQTLTLGGTSTGNINIDSGTGNIYLTDDSTALSNFIVNGTTTLGNNDTSDSLFGSLLTADLGFGTTTGEAFKLDAGGITTGEILEINSTHAPSDGSTNEAIDINVTHSPTGSSAVFSSIDLQTTDSTALSNVVNGISNTVTVAGNASKQSIGINSLVTSWSQTADTLVSLRATTSINTTAGISSGTRNVYGVYSLPQSLATNTGGTSNLYGGSFEPAYSAVADVTGSTVNVYGLYSKPSGSMHTGGTINNFGLYIADGTATTTGTSTKYGLYLEPQTGADSNYGVCFDCDGSWDQNTVGSGIQFGTDANGVNLYRSANNILRTDDGLSVGGSNITFGTFSTDGGLLYTNGSGVLAQTGAGVGTQCLLGGTTPTWGSCSTGGTDSPFSTNLGAIVPNIITNDFLLGAQTTASAKFAVLNINNGTPTASVSATGVTDRPGLYITGTGTLSSVNKGTLTIGSSDTGNIAIGTDATARSISVGNQTGASALTLDSGTGAISIGTTIAKTINLGNATGATAINIDTGTGGINFGDNANTKTIDIGGVTSSGTDTINIATEGTAADILTIGNSNASTTVAITGGNDWNITSGGALTVTSCTGCGGVSSTNSPFEVLNGAIIQKNITIDILAGGTSTASAKFAVLNIDSGTPTASVSATGVVNRPGLYMTGTGNLSSVNKGTLSIGGTNTGEITIDSGSGLITLSDNTTITGNLTVSGAGTHAFSGTLDPSSVAAFTLTGTITGGNQNISSIGDITANSSANVITGFGTVGTNGTTAFTGVSLNITADATISGGDITGAGGAILDIGEATAGDFTFNGDLILPEDGYIGLSGSLPRFVFDTTTTPDEIDVMSANLDLNDNLILNIGNASTDFTSGGGLNIQGTLQLNTLTSNGGVLYTNGTGQVTQIAAGGATQCLLGGTTPTWGSCAAGGTDSPFQVLTGSIVQNNTTLDFLLGGTSTTSAKFAVVGIDGSGTPVASVSATTATDRPGLFMNGTGTLSSVNKGSLTIGSSSTGNIEIGTDATARTVTVGNTTGASALTLNSGTGALSIGTSIAKTITIGNTTGATGLVLNAGTGSVALASTSTGDITLTSADTLLLDSAGVLELNSSAGVISIGNDVVAQNINIGNGAAARTITIGNVTGATAVNFNTGTGGSLFTTTGAGDFTVTSGDDVTINGGGASAAISIGTVATAHTIIIGNETGATSLELDSGTGSISIGNAIAKTINLGNATGATAINIDTGTGGINFGDNANTKTIDIGGVTSSGTDTINIATEGTAADILSIGNSNASTTVAITGGNDWSITAGGALTVASCTGCGGGGSSNWTLSTTNGTLSPNNNTLDFVLGGIATTSAKFAVLNMNGSGPATATVSGNLIVMPTNGSGGMLGIGKTSNLLASLDIKDRNSVASEGTEKITNSNDRTFASDTGNWTTSGSPAWKVNVASSGVASKDAPGTGAIILSNTALDSAAVSNESYQITFSYTTTSSSSGSLTMNFGSSSTLAIGKDTFESATQVQVVVAIASGQLYFTPTSNWYGTIDNISIKKITPSSVALRLESSNGSTSPLEIRSGGDSLYNTFIGNGSGKVNTTGDSNLAVGYQALYSNTTGDQNTANGYQALYSNTIGVYNTANGYQALYGNTIGFYNTANGYQALRNNTDGGSNTANGSYALYSNATGNHNTANGISALYSNTIGYGNTANGSQALYSNTTGDHNTASGFSALYSNTTGFYNTANGYQALYSNTTGFYNTANGYQALYSNTRGFYNTANGYYSGSTNTVGGKNLFLGHYANASDGHLINASAIGANALVGANNSLVLGSIYGVNSATGSAKIGIGTTTPLAPLHINGGYGSNALTIFNQTNSGDIFTASSSGLTRFTIGNDGKINIGTAQGPLGSSTNFNAKLNVWSNFGTAPAASISANTSAPVLLINQDGPGDLIVASKAGQIWFKLTGNGVSDFPNDYAGTMEIGLNATGKLYVGATDPPYTIDGTKFATYAPSTIGLYEEYIGKTVISYDTGLKAYAQKLEFNNFAYHSDLWIFNRIIDPDITDVKVSMTPNSNARTWYKKDGANRTITLYSDRPTEISYRLSAQRYNHAKYPTLRTDGPLGYVPPPPTTNGVSGQDNNINSDPFFDTLTISYQGNKWRLFDANNNELEHTESFSRAIIADIKAGIINAQNIVANNFEAATAWIGNLSGNTLSFAQGSFNSLNTNSLTIGGQNLAAYVEGIVSNFLTSNSQLLTPLAESPSIKTDIISPLSDSSAPSIALENSKLKIKNSGDTVAWFDNQGNASFSGQITANSASISGNFAANSIDSQTSNSQLLTTNEASVSGTLRANNIVANNIEGLDQKIATLASSLNSLLQSPGTSSGSGEFNSIYANLVNAGTLTADFGIFEQGIVSMGPITATDITAMDSLTVGTSMVFSNNSINTLGAELAFQSLRQADITFQGGLIRMDTDGNMNIAGNLNVIGEIDAVFGVFSGTLTTPALAVGMISPLPGDDLTIRLTENSASNAGRLKVTNHQGKEVLSINNKGDVVSSGAATFAKLNFNLVGEAQASTLSEAIASGSAGFATLRSGQPEITIKTPYVTEKSLIYITPFGNTNNKVLYLLRQQPHSGSEVGEEGSFTVGLSGTTVPQNIQFNWLIVN